MPYNHYSQITDIYGVKAIIYITGLCWFFSGPVSAQKIESISFHLYTDSLKKGQYNYINVDGKLSNGKWQPLGEKEIVLVCPEASFQGNELIIPEDFKPLYVTINAALKNDSSIRATTRVWIKQLPDPPLPDRQGRTNKRN